MQIKFPRSRDDELRGAHRWTTAVGSGGYGSLILTSAEGYRSTMSRCRAGQERRFRRSPTVRTVDGNCTPDNSLTGTLSAMRLTFSGRPRHKRTSTMFSGIYVVTVSFLLRAYGPKRFSGKLGTPPDGEGHDPRGRKPHLLRVRLFSGSRLSASGHDGLPLDGRRDSPAGSSPHSHSPE